MVSDSISSQNSSKNFVNFYYKEEIWYISALVKEKNDNEKLVEKQIYNALLDIKNNITKKQLSKISWNPELQNEVVNAIKHVNIKTIKWHSFLDFYPISYVDENNGEEYSKVGYLEIKIEYYKEEQNKKEIISPMIIQQLPILLQNWIREEYATKTSNSSFHFDVESPIYIFVISNKTSEKINWTEKNIEIYRRIIGNWTEIYSGQWPDYGDKLYRERVKNNLSNRTSELHFIRRNSGFIFLENENYNRFFKPDNSYIKNFVLKPTAQIRSMQYVLNSINQSLDILFSMYRVLTENIADKINKLKNLRAMITAKLSVFYNELDLNRRHHYSKVIKHLLQEFRFKEILDRMDRKLLDFMQSMEILFQKQQQEQQERQEAKMNLLNYLFGLGILADIAGLVSGIAARKEDPIGSLISTIFLSGILGIFALLGVRWLKKEREEKLVRDSLIKHTVDAVIVWKNKICLIRRQNPPFQGMYAFPGGFIEKGENKKEALMREIKEETNLELRDIQKIGVFDEPNRDPRGRIISTAYLCKLAKPPEQNTYIGRDDAKTVEFLPIDKLEDMYLAFDHENILKKALKILENKK